MNVKTKIPSKVRMTLVEILEPKTKAQIAEQMGISLRTLQRWIIKYDMDVPRGLVSPKKQEEIYKRCGYPIVSS